MSAEAKQVQTNLDRAQKGGPCWCCIGAERKEKIVGKAIAQGMLPKFISSASDGDVGVWAGFAAPKDGQAERGPVTDRKAVYYQTQKELKLYDNKGVRSKYF